MKTLTVLTAVAAFVATAAFADDPTQSVDSKAPKSTEAKFKSLDRNDDHRLSKSEASADDSLSVQFASVDADGDGYVTQREYTASAGPSDSSSRQPYQ